MDCSLQDVKVIMIRQELRISVRMMDAPDYDEVNVEVLDVLIKDNSDTGDQGW
jgi:hypothetical protein